MWEHGSVNCTWPQMFQKFKTSLKSRNTTRISHDSCRKCDMRWFLGDQHTNYFIAPGPGGLEGEVEKQNRNYASEVTSCNSRLT